MIRILLLSFALFAPAGAEAQTQSGVVARGGVLARENCAACHAIGVSDASRRKGAPPFRVLQRRYDLNALQEALAEGIAVGHRGVDMPEFQFRPDQIDALIAYIRSVSR